LRTDCVSSVLACNDRYLLRVHQWDKHVQGRFYQICWFAPCAFDV
jgi:hypothetical protein